MDFSGALFRAYCRSPAVVVVAATGEIDAFNALAVGQYIGPFICTDRPLVLDFTDVSFIGVPGFRELHAFARECVRAGTDWVLVVNHDMARVLHIFDREGALPVANSLGEALRGFAERRRCPIVDDV